MSSASRSSTEKVRDKWGASLDYAGFQVVPNILLSHQRRLGLSTAEVVILLHLNRYWWTRDQDPYPRPARIAEQMGVTRRSVERCLQGLEKKGLIERLDPRKISGRVARPISLLPLAERLGRLALIGLMQGESAPSRAEDTTSITPADTPLEDSGT